MANKRAPLDKLDQVIAETLDEYQSDVIADVANATQKIVKAGAAVVRTAAGAAVGGTYYKGGWTGKVEQKSRRRYYVKGVIYNSRAPGLAHLLEHGHAVKRGGRVIGSANAYPHLAKAEEQINERFESAVKVVI